MKIRQRGFAIEYLVVGIACALALAALIWAANAFISHIEDRGYKRGIAEQKATDQPIFDKHNADIALQKKEANAMLLEAQADIIALQAERDKLKGKLFKERQDHETVTADLRAKYDGDGLRITVDREKIGGCGPGSSGAEAAAGSAAGNAATATVQLPDATARNLRQLTFDADQVNDDYRFCYDWAQQVK